MNHIDMPTRREIEQLISSKESFIGSDGFGYIMMYDDSRYGRMLVAMREGNIKACTKINERPDQVKKVVDFFFTM